MEDIIDSGILHGNFYGLMGMTGDGSHGLCGCVDVEVGNGFAIVDELKTWNAVTFPLTQT